MRYGAYTNTLMKMEFELGIEYIVNAVSQVQEEKIYNRWLNGYQHIKYEEFKSQLNVIPVSLAKEDETEEIILEKVQNILKGAESKNESI